MSDYYPNPAGFREHKQRPRTVALPIIGILFGILLIVGVFVSAVIA